MLTNGLDLLQSLVGDRKTGNSNADETDDMPAAFKELTR